MRIPVLVCGLVAAALVLAGCGNKGSSAPAPTNVNVVVGDSMATITWDQSPGVEYWLFIAPTSGVTPQNCSRIPGCQIYTHAVSPQVVATPINGGTIGFSSNNGVTGLVNGATYSFSINGRIDKGPGGAGSPTVSFVPRLAGASWSAGSGVSATATLRSIANASNNTMMAVGDAGVAYSSTDGSNWTSAASGIPGTSNLKSITTTSTFYLTVGAGGLIYTSSDAINWAAQTSGTGNDLFGVTGNGGGNYVAVGAGGTIIYSLGNSATSWTVATSGTTNALYGVTYAGGLYVAVGQAGTLLTSTDGITWTSITPVTGQDLKSVAYGGVTVNSGASSGTNTFAAVGNAGALVTSVNGGVNWINQTAIAGNPGLNAVSYGHQFVAVGNGGVVFTSTDGINWASQTSGTANNLYGIARRPYDYAAVGASGTSIQSK